MTARGGAPLLRIHEATRRFGGLYAVQDVSFDLAEGEILGIIGPNGAGKTTLLNLVTGPLRPTSGTIPLAGTLLNGLRPHRIGRLGVARTFQVVRPFANLSVRENVGVGAMFGTGGHRRSAGGGLGTGVAAPCSAGAAIGAGGARPCGWRTRCWISCASMHVVTSPPRV